MKNLDFLPFASADATAASFFGTLAQEDRALLLHEAAARTFRQGDMLTMENQASSYVAILLAGWSKATFVTATGEEIVLRVYGPGDLFGVEAALGDRPRVETVTALTRCNALLVTARRFTELLTRKPGIAHAFNLAMFRRAQAADERMKLRHAPPDVGLACVLLDLAERAGTEAAHGIIIPVELSQEDLASWLGTSRSTVARMLASLRQRDLIRTGYRTITVTDLDQLRKIAAEAW